MIEWQPIETVPKNDGVSIGWQQGPVVLLSNGVDEARGFWREAYQAFTDEGDELYWEEGFATEHADVLHFTPTRWALAQ